jgi:hypothetical protein
LSKPDIPEQRGSITPPLKRSLLSILNAFIYKAFYYNCNSSISTNKSTNTMKTFNKILIVLALGFIFAKCTNDATPKANEANSAGTTATESTAPAASASKMTAFDGSYQHEGNSEEFNGELTLKHIENDRFSFKISTGTASGCTGDVEGEATIGLDGTASFSAPGCEMLKFTFQKGKVIVEEKGCDSNHGMRCPYGGVYSKA